MRSSDARSQGVSEGPPGRVSYLPVIVLGLTATGLGVLRSLERLGVEVHGVYSDPGAEIGRHSRMLRTVHRLADLESDREILDVLEKVRLLAGSPNLMVLIPASDRYARFMSENRATLETAFLFRVPPPAIATTFLDKRSTAEICRRHGVTIPRTCVPETLEDVEREAAQVRYPIIIKPAGIHAGFPGKNVKIADSEELLAFYRSHTDLIPHTVFQELINSGDGHILYVSTFSGADGTVLARCSFRKLRQWLPDRGVTSYGVSETFRELLDMTTSFLNETGYVGFAGVEFAQEVGTGEIFFLELNARTVLPNRLTADAGIDLTTIGYLEMCGADVPQGLVQRDGIYWIDLQHDIPSAFVRRSRGELTLREWVRDVRRATSYSSWDRRDPKPFLASMARLGTTGLGLTSGKQIHSIRSLPRLRRGRWLGLVYRLAPRDRASDQESF